MQNSVCNGMYRLRFACALSCRLPLSFVLSHSSFHLWLFFIDSFCRCVQIQKLIFISRVEIDFPLFAFFYLAHSFVCLCLMRSISNIWIFTIFNYIQRFDQLLYILFLLAMLFNRHNLPVHACVCVCARLTTTTTTKSIGNSGNDNISFHRQEEGDRKKLNQFRILRKMSSNENEWKSKRNMQMWLPKCQKLNYSIRMLISFVSAKEKSNEKRIKINKIVSIDRLQTANILCFKCVFQVTTSSADFFITFDVMFNASNEKKNILQKKNTRKNSSFNICLSEKGVKDGANVCVCVCWCLCKRRKLLIPC